MTADADPEPTLARQHRSERLLATLAPFSRVVLVSHVNPDPDALASMLGLKALIDALPAGQAGDPDGRRHDRPRREPGDGRARSRSRWCRSSRSPIDAGTAVVMVDSQPHTGRRASEAAMPQVVIDHHETGGVLDRRRSSATSAPTWARPARW